MITKPFKQIIQKELYSTTFAYFKYVEVFFKDYVYGDPYYLSLPEVICRYISQNHLDELVNGRCSGIFDWIELVSRLYERYIKADLFYKSSCSGNERDRKNYLMKSLLNETGHLLNEQLDRYQLLCQDNEELHHPEFKHVSIYCRVGLFLDDLSWKMWKMEQDDIRDIEFQRQLLDASIGVLNNTEHSVVDLILEGWSNREICNRLRLKQDSLRKIIYSAKRKLRKRYHESKSIRDDSLN
jgi:DNA-binding CsgD family transcriptional regulator